MNEHKRMSETTEKDEVLLPKIIKEQREDNLFLLLLFFFLNILSHEIKLELIFVISLLGRL